jgi:hypothetical protein
MLCDIDATAQEKSKQKSLQFHACFLLVRKICAIASVSSFPYARTRSMTLLTGNCARLSSLVCFQIAFAI